MTVPVKAPQTGEIMEAVLIKGDLSKLTPGERAEYYMRVCQSIGLNPLTRPLEYITLSGKLTLYAKRDCADQLRKINGISVQIISQDQHDGLLSIHVRAKDRAGREDEDLGVVALPDTLKGEARANAMLKAVTKAKRRVTLSISGLGFLDETEVEDIPAREKRPAPPAANVMVALPPHDENGEIIEENRGGSPTSATGAGAAIGVEPHAAPASNSVAEPAHPARRSSEKGPAGDSGSDQAKQGGTADDRNSRGRHGPHSSEDDLTETLMRHDRELGEAATQGMAALKAVYDALPADIEPHLRSAVNRRHKPTAIAADEKTGAQA